MTFLDAKGQVKEVQKIRVAEEDLSTLCDKTKKMFGYQIILWYITNFREIGIFPFGPFAPKL